jgi:hypothetical protein
VVERVSRKVWSPPARTDATIARGPLRRSSSPAASLPQEREDIGREGVGRLRREDFPGENMAFRIARLPLGRRVADRFLRAR